MQFTNVWFAVILASLALSYPLIGWLADTKFGKFKFLRASSYLLAAAIVLKSIGVLVYLTIHLLYASMIVWSVA